MKQKTTVPVSESVFWEVYDSPASLPGSHKWLTNDGDVRKIENLLGTPPNTIGAPLWVSGDRKTCPQCDRETNWLDIVASGLEQVHRREIIARAILGDKSSSTWKRPARLPISSVQRAKRPSRTSAASSATTGRTQNRHCWTCCRRWKSKQDVDVTWILAPGCLEYMSHARRNA